MLLTADCHPPFFGARPQNRNPVMGSQALRARAKQFRESMQL
jgi:hypothetical protein